MYVIEVIVFAKTAPVGTLSYRSREMLAPGSLVQVPLRNNTVLGMVVACISALEAKATLKTAHFMLKASSVTRVGGLPESVVDAAKETALYHATSLGSVLSTFFKETLPQMLPEHYYEGGGYARIEEECTEEKRYATYAAVIEKYSQQEQTTLLVLPTLAEIDRAKVYFKNFHPTVLSSTLGSKKRIEAFQHAALSTTLVISTPAFSYIPIAALAHIIVERPSASTYKVQTRPYIDMVRALDALARARNISITVGDFPLPLELRTTPDAGLNKSTLAPVSIVNVKRKEDAEPEVFRAVPQVLLNALEEVLQNNGRAVVMALRRGYAPTVLCRDCGTTVKDTEGNTLSLSIEGGVRVLRSSTGRAKRDADAVCDLCGSWNLMPLGVGVERVEEELRIAFPSARLVRFDSDTVRTPAQARKLAATFVEPGTIIIGTEFTLPWLPSELALDTAMIASADSLLALPFWRARERFVRLALLLRARAKKVLVVTRREGDSVFDAIAHPDTTDFFAEETGLRNALGYPPFGTFISLEMHASVASIATISASVSALLAPYTFTQMPDRLLAKGLVRRLFVVRLPVDAWPEMALSEAISTLPPGVRVRVDAESFY